MQFPFMPGGALLALAVLGGALAIFGAALKALDWTIDAARGSMLDGIVSGIRDWDLSRHASPGSPSAATVVPTPAAEVVEISEEASIELERVTPSDGVRRGD